MLTLIKRTDQNSTFINLKKQPIPLCKIRLVAYFQCKQGVPPHKEVTQSFPQKLGRRDGGPQTTCRGAEARREGSAAEGSHTGSDGAGTAERGACQGSPGGRRGGQKSERGRQEEGKREQRVHGSPPVVLLAFAPGSVSPRGAAGCSHAETPAFLSPPRLLPAQGLPTRANLQHMRPSPPAPPTHTRTQ